MSKKKSNKIKLTSEKLSQLLQEAFCEGIATGINTDRGVNRGELNKLEAYQSFARDAKDHAMSAIESLSKQEWVYAGKITRKIKINHE